MKCPDRGVLPSILPSILPASERGSTAVEAAIAATGICVTVVGALIALYCVFARVWLERQCYEALICLSSLAPDHICESVFRASVSGALPIGEVNGLHLHRDSEHATIQVRFDIDGHTVVRRSDSLTLPLLGGPGDRASQLMEGK